MVKVGNIELGTFPLLLAPMEDVSDPPFRHVCKQNGADLMFTEFISSEGLIRSAAKSVKKLDLFHDEHPVGIQIFGSDEEPMMEATRIADAARPDLIDINYGCPVKNVVCKGAGAAILQYPDKMERLTRKIVEATNLPVTVKTRLGWDENSKYIVEVAERLQDVGIKAISIHGRTRKQMYKGEADWTLIGEVKNNPRMHIPIFGNGDVTTPQKALEMKNRYGIDGIMIGRAAIGYPWIFNEIKHFMKTGEMLSPPTLSERIYTCKVHLQKSVEWKGEFKAVIEMRKHYHQYFKGLYNFKPFRKSLVTVDSVSEVYNLLDQIGEYYSQTSAQPAERA